MCHFGEATEIELENSVRSGFLLLDYQLHTPRKPCVGRMFPLVIGSRIYSRGSSDPETCHAGDPRQ